MFFSIKKSILDGDINKLNKELKMNLVKYFIKNIITYFKYLVKGDQILSNKWKNRSKEDVEKYLDNVGELHRVWLINFFKSENSFLEIGCGWGPNLQLLRLNNKRSKVQGIDISYASAEIGRKKVYQ
jgi:ubiquinone/menaquinone biosynthesis C-methylase UbiE